jgi:hypothetical protein
VVANKRPLTCLCILDFSSFRRFANQKWVYGKPNHHVAKVMEKNWQGLQNIMLYHATADSLAYIGEDSSLDLFFLPY